MSIKLESLGIQVPSILLPGSNVDLFKWSVVACDQYTSEPEYWNKVKDLVGDAPSTLHVVFPEVYLEEPGKDDRINKINDAMKEYLNTKVLIEQKPAMIYIDRKTSHAKSRKGLIMAVDLEKYDYNKGSQTLIRATEGTVIERLPPRIRIRRNASIESPHIMLLIDDPTETVIEPLAARTESMEKLYDFDLMMDGMHIKGYNVDSPDLLTGIEEALNQLSSPEVFYKKYGVDTDKGVLLFAVGDGNHSLASAKGHWDLVKKTLSEEEIKDHPARFALVEVVNVHDQGLKFEPIHRVVFDVNPKQLLEDMIEYLKENGSEASFQSFQSMECMLSETKNLKEKGSSHGIPFLTEGFAGVMLIKNPRFNLEVGTLQCFLDEYMKKHTEAKIDYIHGLDVVVKLGSQKNNIGFILPAMDKQDLFKTVILDGALPRKTFSMGEAEEKRFYLECRKIVKD